MKFLDVINIHDEKTKQNVFSACGKVLESEKEIKSFDDLLNLFYDVKESVMIQFEYLNADDFPEVSDIPDGIDKEFIGDMNLVLGEARRMNKNFHVTTIGYISQKA